MTSGGRYAGSAVLVTGGRGFVGARLARRLEEEGARVLAPPSAELDVVDTEAVGRVLAQHRVAAVFHLAARSTLAGARDDPLGTFEVNVRGTWSVLEACRSSACPPPRVVVASSHRAGAVDGPYDASKACAEAVGRSYARALGVPVATLRLANVYGPGDRNFTRLVPGIAQALVRGEPPVLRSDGTPERDFLHVDDAIEAYLAVAASLDAPGAGGRVWDGGAGEAVPVIEVVRRLIAASGRRVDPVVRGRPGGERRDRQAVDPSGLRDELGWRPRRDLGPGLAEAYRWYERELS